MHIRDLFLLFNWYVSIKIRSSRHSPGGQSSSSSGMGWEYNTIQHTYFSFYSIKCVIGISKSILFDALLFLSSASVDGLVCVPLALLYPKNATQCNGKTMAKLINDLEILLIYICIYISPVFLHFEIILLNECLVNFSVWHFESSTRRLCLFI